MVPFVRLKAPLSCWSCPSRSYRFSGRMFSRTKRLKNGDFS